MITDKPCLAHLRDGNFAVVDQIYPGADRPLTGRILSSCPSEKDGFKLHFITIPFFSWLSNGAVVSCNEHHYDIMEVSPLPHLAVAERFQDLRDQIALLTKKEAAIRSYCYELRNEASKLLLTKACSNSIFDKLRVMIDRPL